MSRASSVLPSPLLMDSHLQLLLVGSSCPTEQLATLPSFPPPDRVCCHSISLPHPLAPSRLCPAQSLAPGPLYRLLAGPAPSLPPPTTHPLPGLPPGCFQNTRGSLPTRGPGPRPHLQGPWDSTWVPLTACGSQRPSSAPEPQLPVPFAPGELLVIQPHLRPWPLWGLRLAPPPRPPLSNTGSNMGLCPRPSSVLSDSSLKYHIQDPMSIVM